jgi:hypothetical protein
MSIILFGCLDMKKMRLSTMAATFVLLLYMHGLCNFAGQTLTPADDWRDEFVGWRSIFVSVDSVSHGLSTSDIDKNSYYCLVEKSNVSQPLISSRVMEIRGIAKMVLKKSS